MEPFVKNNGKKKLVIPSPVMELSGIGRDDAVKIYPLPGTVVIVKREKTAMELVTVIEQLRLLGSRLAVELARTCGLCDGCDGGCPIDLEHPGSGVELPDWLRQEKGIPRNAKLCAWLNEATGLVEVDAADYDYDLSDVPRWLLEAFAACGVCLSDLEELLKANEPLAGDASHDN